MKPGFILVLTVTALLILCSCTSCDRRDTQPRNSGEGSLNSGRAFLCLPVLTAFQGGFTVRQDSATAAFPAIRCRCGRRAVRRRSRPGHLHLRRSHFAMSSISPKFIPLIIKDIRFSNLLDPAYFATKRPSSPISSQVQQMSFPRAFDYQAFL